MKHPVGAQMNTNLNMLPVLLKVVHIHAALECNKNAQKFSKMLPR
jgi:hypothetical protein